MAMTHDELLAKFKNLSPESKVCNALRAVVELHKPKEFEFNDYPVLVCGHCQLGVVGDRYPCETIQAIEKELTLGD